MAKLIAYVIDGHTVDIRPAPMERAWMDATDQRFAYLARCVEPARSAFYALLGLKGPTQAAL